MTPTAKLAPFCALLWAVLSVIFFLLIVPHRLGRFVSTKCKMYYPELKLPGAKSFYRSGLYITLCNENTMELPEIHWPNG